jgi:hypothetical protein
MADVWVRRVGVMAAAGFIAAVLAIGVFDYTVSETVGPVFIAAAAALAVQLMNE